MLEEPQQYIKFWKASDKYGFLSNFYTTHSFTLRGKHWRTVEHYYQAQKFSGTPYEESIRLAGSPAKAKKLGNARDAKAGPIRKDWGRVKEHIMYEGLTAKFTQYDYLKVQLLETGNDILVEFSKKDSYWGDGGNGSGLNRLGALLMNLREELRNNSLPVSQETLSPQQPEPTQTEPSQADNEDQEDKSDFTESDEGIPEKPNNEPLEIEDIDDGDINQDGTIIAKGPSKPTSAQKARKKKNRNQMRKNVWKDQTGSSILARDNESRDQVSVVNQNINFPMNILPPNAKLVVHQHQYKRRYINDSEEEEDDNNDDEYYPPPSTTTKSTLHDYIVDKTKKEVLNKVSPRKTDPVALIDTAAENINLIKSLSPTEPIYEEIKQNLINIKAALIQQIEITQQDHILSQLLAHVEAINEIEN